MTIESVFRDNGENMKQLGIKTIKVSTITQKHVEKSKILRTKYTSS